MSCINQQGEIPAWAASLKYYLCFKENPNLVNKPAL